MILKTFTPKFIQDNVLPKHADELKILMDNKNEIYFEFVEYRQTIEIAKKLEEILGKKYISIGSVYKNIAKLINTGKRLNSALSEAIELYTKEDIKYSLLVDEAETSLRRLGMSMQGTYNELEIELKQYINKHAAEILNKIVGYKLTIDVAKERCKVVEEITNFKHVNPKIALDINSINVICNKFNLNKMSKCMPSTTGEFTRRKKLKKYLQTSIMLEDDIANVLYQIIERKIDSEPIKLMNLLSLLSQTIDECRCDYLAQRKDYLIELNSRARQLLTGDFQKIILYDKKIQEYYNSKKEFTLLSINKPSTIYRETYSTLNLKSRWIKEHVDMIECKITDLKIDNICKIKLERCLIGNLIYKNELDVEDILQNNVVINQIKLEV